MSPEEYEATLAANRQWHNAVIREMDNMTPKQYRKIIEDLGLSQEAAGVWFGVSKRTGQNWATKGPPEPVAKLLRLMVRLKLTPDEVA